MSAEYRRLYRSRDERMLGGVAGGLARYFGVDPTIMRLLFVILTVAGGPGLIAYIILWIIVPEEPGSRVTPPPAPSVGEPFDRVEPPQPVEPIPPVEPTDREESL